MTKKPDTIATTQVKTDHINITELVIKVHMYNIPPFTNKRTDPAAFTTYAIFTDNIVRFIGI